MEGAVKEFMVVSSCKQKMACWSSYIMLSIWGFLKSWEIPSRHFVGFNTKMVYLDLDDLGYLHLLLVKHHFCWWVADPPFPLTWIPHLPRSVGFLFSSSSNWANGLSEGTLSTNLIVTSRRDRSLESPCECITRGIVPQWNCKFQVNRLVKIIVFFFSEELCRIPNHCSML